MNNVDISLCKETTAKMYNWKMLLLRSVSFVKKKAVIVILLSLYAFRKSLFLE